MFQIAFSLVLIILSSCMVCEAHEEETAVIKQGNFALSSSQQPFPLFSFGQTIVDKYDLMGFFEMSFFRGPSTRYSEVIPSVLYGIRDDLALFVMFPIIAGQKNGSARSSGMGDIMIQMEYVFFNKTKPTASNEATVVGSITLPTGSATKSPITGFGSPAFFLGFTLDHLSIKWYAFTSQGIQFTTKNLNIKVGNQFFYQFGFGRNIESPKGWIFMLMCELVGQYSQRNSVQGIVNENSGGNTFLILPSLWFSSKRFIGQMGVGCFPVQHLFGQQNKNKHVLAANIGWKF